jgi:uncharacterized protein
LILTQNMKDALKSNISYLATSSKDGNPNVVPMGFVEAIDDSHIMIVDVYMNKTRANLVQNNRAALAITDFSKSVAYQLKGKVKIVRSGEFFERAKEIAHKWTLQKRQHLTTQFKETNDALIKAKLEFAKTYNLEPNAVVIMEVEEIYPTIMSPV